MIYMATYVKTAVYFLSTVNYDDGGGKKVRNEVRNVMPHQICYQIHIQSVGPPWSPRQTFVPTVFSLSHAGGFE